MTLEDKILEALREIKQGTILEIYTTMYPKGSGSSIAAVQQRMGHMLREGKLVRPSRGLYKVKAK